MGTSPSDIDKAEDRQKFSQLLDVLKVDQPAWKELTSLQEAETFCRTVCHGKCRVLLVRTCTRCMCLSRGQGRLARQGEAGCCGEVLAARNLPS